MDFGRRVFPEVSFLKVSPFDPFGKAQGRLRSGQALSQKPAPRLRGDKLRRDKLPAYE